MTFRSRNRDDRSLRGEHTAASLINIGARAVLEAGIVAAFGYWGYAVGTSEAARVFLALLAPSIVFGFWGGVDFRFVGHHAELLRLTQELVVSALASAALYTTGHVVLSVLLFGLSIAHHLAVYLLGQRLLKASPDHPSTR